MRTELAEVERKRELESLAARLDAEYEDPFGEPGRPPLPATVAAYRDVYDRLPERWPHPDM